MGATTTTIPVIDSPAAFQTAATQILASSTATERSVAVNVDGRGTVLDVTAESPRIPASTQKILVAGAILAALGPNYRFTTEARASSIADPAGAIDELFVRASGDPSLTTAQLQALADAVAAAGVKTIRGGLVVDSRFDSSARVATWKPSFTPGEVGFLDAFSVDGNHRNDRDTASDAGIANLKRFRAALVKRKIGVGPGERRGTLDDGGPVLGSVQSAPLRELVKTMMKKSDNTYAELFTKELGARAGVGSTNGGVGAIASYLASLGVKAPAMQVDGSGLSLLNRTSPRTQVQFLEKAAVTPYARDFLDSFPIACSDGTLKNRLCGPTTTRHVVAKTGTIDFVVALAGYTETASRHRVTFSFLLNGVRSSSAARAAVDRIVTLVSASQL